MPFRYGPSPTDLTPCPSPLRRRGELCKRREQTLDSPIAELPSPQWAGGAVWRGAGGEVG